MLDPLPALRDRPAAEHRRPGPVVIGVGSRDRGDDAVGLLAARLLRRRLPAAVAATCGSADPLSLIALGDGADAASMIVFGVDAAGFALGSRPSAEVRTGARQAAHAVAAEVAAAARER